LAGSPKVPFYDRITLATTFDRFVVYSKDFKRLVDALRQSSIWLPEQCHIRKQADDIEKIIEAAPGLVVLDEAYHVFAGKTFMGQLARHPNLVVLRTVSKLGLAGIRLGYLAGRAEWLREFNKVRQVYNVNVLTQAAASFVLERLDVLEAQAAQIRAERAHLGKALAALPGVTAFPSEANFFLVRVPDAGKVDAALKRQGVLVRNLHPGIAQCLRLTVGTPDENRILVTALKEALQ